MIGLLIIFAIFIFLIVLYFKFIKVPKLKNILFVDGSLGTGKSFLSVNLAVRIYKKNLRRFYISRFIQKYILGFFSKKFKNKIYEKPCLYTNMNLSKVSYTLVNQDLLFRRKYRFAKNSVLLLDEFSLVADSQLIRNQEINERLLTFFKLFRHEVGSRSFMVINSQSTSDIHYSLKNVLSDYIYIHSRIKLPFISLLRVQEMAYCNDKNGGNITNTTNEDIEKQLKYMVVLNKYYKYYDSTCYSIFTDSLPVYVNDTYHKDNKNLKTDILVSFRDFKYLYDNLNKVDSVGVIDNEKDK